MRHYETVFIADPDLAPEVQENLFEKSRALISGNQGELVDFDEWGNRRLAYEIRKKQRGHYVRLDYCGDGRTVRELENAFRIDDRVLKFMTIFIGDNADPGQLREAVEAGRQAAESDVESLPDDTAASPDGSEGDVGAGAADTGAPDTDAGGDTGPVSAAADTATATATATDTDTAADTGSDTVTDTGSDTATDDGDTDSGRSFSSDA